MPMHVSEPVVAALELVGEAFVVNAEEVQHRGLEIVDVDFVTDRNLLSGRCAVQPNCRDSVTTIFASGKLSAN